MLVGENGATSDSLAVPKSLNHTNKMAENTGRWRPRDSVRARARVKRSLRQRRILGAFDDDDVDDDDVVDANGDGIKAHESSVNGFSSNTLIARSKNALPQQMYDAMVWMSSERKKIAPVVVRPRRHHQKRQTADVIVYRKDAADTTGNGNAAADETVDIVPLLDSERRIRVNLTIASDDQAGSPVYAVSLSLPGAEQPQNVPPPHLTEILPPDPPSYSAGSECDCFCPCLEQDYGQTTVTTSNVIFSTNPSETGPTENETSDTFWTITSPTTSERPDPIEVSCPPPVLLYCEPGEYHLPVLFCTWEIIDDDTTTALNNNNNYRKYSMLSFKVRGIIFF